MSEPDPFVGLSDEAVCHLCLGRIPAGTARVVRPGLGEQAHFLCWKASR